MKKWVILLVVAALIGGTWYYVRNYVRYTPVWYQAKYGKVTRGDIEVPVTASGRIEPEQQIEVKSKASGEVIDVPVNEGTWVRTGDVLLELKKDDEQRRFDSAQAEFDRASALLEKAKVGVDQAQAQVERMLAEVRRVEAELATVEYDLNKARELYEQNNATLQELNTLENRYRASQAAHDIASANLKSTRVSLEDARQSVALQEAVLKQAQTTLGDAQERLDETTIRAKQDALVTEVRVKVGEVIQSGTTSLTGGTVVMYLADVSKKKVIARVDESDYGRVLKISPVDALPEMPGLRGSVAESAEELERRSGNVRLTVDAFPEEIFQGRIERVEPQGRLNQGSAIIQYDVHVEITDDRANMLPLGAQAQVEFTVESARDVLRVPSDAVKSSQGQRGIYLRVPPEPGSNEQWGKQFVACRFGITDGEHTHIIETVGDEELEGEQVVYTKLPVDPEDLED